MDVRQPHSTALRRAALAVSVLYDIDLVPIGDGIALQGRPTVPVGWDECAAALRGADPESADGRDRLRRWLQVRRWVADAVPADLAERARPVGVPVGHPLHPGSEWVARRVLGDTLELGLGVVGLDPARPDDVVVVPDAVTRGAGLDPAALWPAADDYLEWMGAMAAARWRREPQVPLRPMGDCDVVTLLGSATLRGALVATEAGGMRALAVPMRSRGWLDLARIDPAFALAAAAATEPADRGFERPVLVTAEEVVLARDGGRPAEIVLRDPAAERGWQRDVLYR